ncbi:SOS response-associated peptidase [Bacillus sp. 1P06AnD]|uniref:SOS response-associated peptidase n=1 Tax=Bacillus sp. 1P06AnD TaxID=3132208 RepID=UPI00399EF86D
MCGRFTLYSDYEKIIKRFEIGSAFPEEEYKRSYNIAPSQEVAAIINDGSQNRLGFIRWGLVPSWAKDEKMDYSLMNARAETITEKPSFRASFEKRRCLIIADSFYEWKKTDGTKSPMTITLKENHPFGMAGIWDCWKRNDGTKLYSCTILTTSSNSFMSDIHERMPVILHREDEEAWLNPANNDQAALLQLLKPYDSNAMEAYVVSDEVNSPKNNGPALIKALS